MALTRSQKRARPTEALSGPLPPAKRIKSIPKPVDLEELVANPSPKQLASSSTSNDAGAYARRFKAKKAATKKFNASWKHMPASAQKGMHNPHILCYRNSMLQSLLHTPKFVNWARVHKGCDSDGKKPCVACALKEMVGAYWAGSNEAFHHSLFLYQKAVKANGGASGDLEGQADPAELLSWMIEVLEKQLPSSHFDFFQAFSRNLLSDTMECKKCGHIHTKLEAEGTICLPIKPRIQGGGVAEYLDPYLNFSVEGFRCEKCGNNATKQRVRRIAHSADFLVVQLKRFDYSGSKDSFQIRIPTILDLNRHRTPANKSSSKYHLSSVISHQGTMQYGHYICTAKDGNDTWHTFDDKRMTQTTAASASQGGMKGFTPYVLFYQRK